MGEEAAWKRLARFMGADLAGYAAGHLSHASTSRLSAHLRFGEISSRQVAWALRAGDGDDRLPEPSTLCFLRALGGGA